MSLATYHKKRRFERTPEPKGSTSASDGPLHFVVQKHDATRLHYDFRLELDGVLKSWAVPKGPSLNPADKRLAVQVEDHPFDYRTFEGVIPEGNYGAGAVMVWDEGTYRAVGNPKGAEARLRRGLENGRISFVLDGKKLQGEFTLVRMPEARNMDGKNWLLIKKRDRWASEADVTSQDRSVASGRSLASIAEKQTPGSKSRMPHRIKPMLATLVDEPFDRPGWIFEVKWDGYRAIAEIGKGRVELYSRNFISFTKRYAPIVETLRTLEHEAVLDGEVVVVDERGHSRFQSLQNYTKTGEGSIQFYVFDLLGLDGRDLRDEPLHVRRDLLAPLIKELPNVHLSEAIADEGVDFYNAAVKHGLEGIIAKDRESKYAPGLRGPDWLKIKTRQRQEAVISGYTEPRGSRKDFGALVLGVYEKDELVYIGHTGGGFDTAGLAALKKRLVPLERRECPFPRVPKVNAPVHWVEPRLVCEVVFQEWTGDGRMRQPIFVGLREDKQPAEVTREVPKDVEPTVKKATSKPRKRLKAPPKSDLKLTNLDKVYWPAEGYTKGDMIEYYREVASTLLPYLRDRPLSLNRHPNGIEGKNFFQKDVSKLQLPTWVKSVPIASETRGETIEYALCQNEESLLYFANLGCIEINPWNSRVGKLDRPDYLVIDLDPQDVPFPQVVEAALAVRKTLEGAGGACYCKTSGKRGLHIFVPLAAKYDNDDARRFAELLATVVHQQLPATTSLVRDPKKRRNKIYLDFLQNRKGQTLAAPYSLRPAPGATVSTPLEWSEVRKSLDPTAFTIKNTLKRLDRVGDIWEDVLGSGIDLARCLSRLET